MIKIIAYDNFYHVNILRFTLKNDILDISGLAQYLLNVGVDKYITERRTKMDYGILSLLPIVLTILLAMWLKNISIALFVGAFAGLLIMSSGNPITAIMSYVIDHLVPNMVDSYCAEVLILLIFIGGFVKLLEVSGGAHAFASSVTKFVNSRAKAQMAGWFAGIIIFFSDIGSPIIAGPIVQPLTDKMKVSREKLAWILDTTASPLSILVPFLGWGAYIMGLMGAEFQAIGYNANEWDMLLKAWPLQYYALLSLMMVPLIAFTKKEFGPMYDAEKRALAGQVSPDSNEIDTIKVDTGAKLENSRPMVMIIPLLVMIGTLCWILVPQGFPFKSVDGDQLRGALIAGFVFGSVANIILVVVLKIKSLKAICADYVSGLESVASVFITLLLAWVLSSVTKAMGGPEFVVNMMQDNVPAWILPVIIFVASAIISFSTGSSWGTFSIMMTIAIPAAVALNAPMQLAIAAVLSGGLFGDHCSPISDTTILSATGAKCDLLAHVKTQLPYAIMVGCVTIVTYAIAGLTGGNVAVLLVGIVLLVVTVMILSKLYGKKVTEPANEVA